MLICVSSKNKTIFLQLEFKHHSKNFVPILLKHLLPTFWNIGIYDTANILKATTKLKKLVGNM